MGGIVSKSLQNIFKENKTGIAAGAGLGLISSWGLLPGLLVTEHDFLESFRIGNDGYTCTNQRPNNWASR